MNTDHGTSDAPLILSLETATMGGSIFLGRGSVELATRTGDPQVSQSFSLLSDTSEVLKEAFTSLHEVDLFACASGPGSFTGLRIGLATVKALAASLKRPCVGIPTLHAIAYAAGPSRRTVALLPAGRGEVFAQMFFVAGDGTVTQVDSAAHLSAAKLVERYAGFDDLCWAGSGADLQRNFLRGYAVDHQIDFVEEAGEVSAERGEKTWRLMPARTNLAKAVASLALKVFHAGNMQSPQSLRAIYVRPSDAELSQQCRQ
jgi:tRNA threonylcarbamoyladenosine biosynthesis protein TsaB